MFTSAVLQCGFDLVFVLNRRWTQLCVLICEYKENLTTNCNSKLELLHVVNCWFTWEASSPGLSIVLHIIDFVNKCQLHHFFTRPLWSICDRHSVCRFSFHIHVPYFQCMWTHGCICLTFISQYLGRDTYCLVEKT